jgi:uncharacterized protein with ParB-like and HNH nuclease domain
MLGRLFLCVILAQLLLFTSQVGPAANAAWFLPEPRSEADEAILKDFMRVPRSRKDSAELLAEFTEFKKQWIEQMVEFMIKEFELDEKGAKQARLNPKSFYIDYDTYKLFAPAS